MSSLMLCTAAQLQHSSCYSPAHLVSLLPTLAEFGHQPSPLIHDSLVAAIQRSLPLYDRHELVALLYALAALSSGPSAGGGGQKQVGELVDHVCSRCLLPQEQAEEQAQAKRPGAGSSSSSSSGGTNAGTASCSGAGAPLLLQPAAAQPLSAPDVCSLLYSLVVLGRLDIQRFGLACMALRGSPLTPAGLSGGGGGGRVPAGLRIGQEESKARGGHVLSIEKLGWVSVARCILGEEGQEMAEHVLSPGQLAALDGAWDDYVGRFLWAVRLAEMESRLVAMLMGAAAVLGWRWSSVREWEWERGGQQQQGAGGSGSQDQQGGHEGAGGLRRQAEQQVQAGAAAAAAGVPMHAGTAHGRPGAFMLDPDLPLLLLPAATPGTAAVGAVGAGGGGVALLLDVCLPPECSVNGVGALLGPCALRARLLSVTLPHGLGLLQVSQPQLASMSSVHECARYLQGLVPQQAQEPRCELAAAPPSPRSEEA